MNATTVHLYKHKSVRQTVIISEVFLYSVAGKILAQVILNGLNTYLVKTIFPKSQYGFQSGQGTIDMIFTARQLQKKFWEQNCGHYMVLVDLIKAFDTINHERLWKPLFIFGQAAKFISVIRSFHDGDSS